MYATIPEHMIPLKIRSRLCAIAGRIFSRGCSAVVKGNREELLESIRKGTFKSRPVRRKEILKPDGSVRKLRIPTAVERIVQ